MKNVFQYTSSCLLFLCLLFTQCSKTPDTPVAPKSSVKTLTSPTIEGITGASSTFDAGTFTYTVTVPSGTAISALKVSFILPSVATAKPTSGSTQNFTTPVTYAVTAEDGSTQNYIIKVLVEGAPKISDKQIITFTFASLNPMIAASIDQTSRKITATVPATTNITSLIPTITVSSKATISPTSGVGQNFTNPVNYTVTAEDGSKQSYEVSLKKESAVDANTNIVYISGYAFNADTGNLLWFNNVGLGEKGDYSPVIQSGIVCTNVGSSFYGLDLYTGATKWEFKLSGNSYLQNFSSPVVIGNTVYTSATIYTGGALVGSMVYAIDINTGLKKWEFSSNNTVTLGRHLVVDSDVIYASISDKIFALDATTGIKKWEVNIPSFAYLDPSNIKTGFVNSNPCVYNKTLYFTNAVSNAYKIDLTKSPISITSDRKYDLGLENGAMTVFNNLIYYTGSKGLVVLTPTDLSNGNLYTFETSTSSANPSIYDEMVYVKNGTGTLIAIDAKTLVKRWEYRVQFAQLVNPVGANGLVYIGDGNITSNTTKLYAIDAKTGQKKWEQTLNTLSPSTPVVRMKDGTVYYSSISGMQP